MEIIFKESFPNLICGVKGLETDFREICVVRCTSTEGVYKIVFIVPFITLESSINVSNLNKGDQIETLKGRVKEAIRSLYRDFTPDF